MIENLEQRGVGKSRPDTEEGPDRLRLFLVEPDPILRAVLLTMFHALDPSWKISPVASIKELQSKYPGLEGPALAILSLVDGNGSRPSPRNGFRNCGNIRFLKLVLDREKDAPDDLAVSDPPEALRQKIRSFFRALPGSVERIPHRPVAARPETDRARPHPGRNRAAARHQPEDRRYPPRAHQKQAGPPKRRGIARVCPQPDLQRWRRNLRKMICVGRSPDGRGFSLPYHRGQLSRGNGVCMRQLKWRLDQ